MANRINGNVIIVDSAMGNGLLFTGVVNLDEVQVSAFGFLAVDTTSTITLTHADTSLDIVFKTGYIVQGAGTSIRPSLEIFPFAKPVRLGNLKAPVVTAGTGFIYLA